jgi:hypothetical protein
MYREQMQGWITSILKSNGGQATLIDVSKSVWHEHEAELRASGDGFFTWQYDLRWAADQLRRNGVLKPAALSPRSVWELNP